MKKLLFIMAIGMSVAFTSCGNDKECVCSAYTYTQADADDAGSTLDELCTVAKIGDSSCEMN